MTEVYVLLAMDENPVLNGKHFDPARFVEHYVGTNCAETEIVVLGNTVKAWNEKADGVMLRSLRNGDIILLDDTYYRAIPHGWSVVTPVA